MSDWVTEAVLITHDVGLHARPAVVLMRLARSFESIVEIAKNDAGPWIDAKSIVKVMGLKAKSGATLYIRARGEDAKAATRALAELVEMDFEEEAHAQHSRA
jgi:phosphocarrier protein HPr